MTTNVAANRTIDCGLTINSTVFKPHTLQRNVVESTVTYHMSGIDSANGKLVFWEAVGNVNNSPAITHPALVGNLVQPAILYLS